MMQRTLHRTEVKDRMGQKGGGPMTSTCEMHAMVGCLPASLP